MNFVQRALILLVAVAGMLMVTGANASRRAKAQGRDADAAAKTE